MPNTDVVVGKERVSHRNTHRIRVRETFDSISVEVTTDAGESDDCRYTTRQPPKLRSNRVECERENDT